MSGFDDGSVRPALYVGSNGGTMVSEFRVERPAMEVRFISEILAVDVCEELLHADIDYHGSTGLPSILYPEPAIFQHPTDAQRPLTPYRLEERRSLAKQPQFDADLLCRASRLVPPLSGR